MGNGRPDPHAGFRLDLEWRTTVLTLVLLPAMLGLGLWQLQRADEKAAIAARWEQRKLQPPVMLEQVSTDDTTELEYLPVQLSGYILADQYFLLDNRINRGKFGYEVLGVMLLEQTGQVVLVNRGWIAADSSRQSLPEVPVVSGPLIIKGHVYVAPGAPYLLADLELEPGWPKRIQAIEMDKLRPVVKELAGAQLFPYSVRIDPDQPAALTVDWQVINVSPEKHTGYAVQWFTMALALLIFFILRSSNLWQVLTGGTRKDSER
jgi:cytochrome oxidase assembly protein ShyY1